MRHEDRVTALTLLKKRVDAELAAAKSAFQADSRPRDRRSSVIAGIDMGSVSLTAGRLSYKVVNMDALLDWCAEHAEHLLELTISQDNLKVLLRNPVNSDGEMLPGVELVEGDPYVTVRLSDGAATAFADAVAAGEISFDGVMAGELSD